MSTLSPLKKIQKARAALITSQPFFGSLALRLLLAERADIPTCAVDGVTMFYNADFVEKLTMPELTGVVAHETLHCALDHIGRIKGRDHDQFNIACDYAVNPIIRDSGLTLPKSALIDSRYSDMSADQIYNLLPAKAPKDAAGGTGAGAGSDPGGCGGMLPAPADMTPAEVKKLAQDWKVATIQAANTARAAGKMPGSIARLVDEIKQPEIDWRDVLRGFVTSTIPTNYSWTPPNRRFIASGLYLPKMKPDRIGEIAIMIDTSGSINQTALAMFNAELNAILEDCMPDRTHVIYCDTRVNKAEEHDAQDYPVKLSAQGGGGTSFAPPFAHLEQNGIAPTLAIYMTDLESSDFAPEPDFPVLWLCTAKNGRAPWGEVVTMPSAR
jgi:predicted metal-dependent peptidase